VSATFPTHRPVPASEIVPKERDYDETSFDDGCRCGCCRFAAASAADAAPHGVRVGDLTCNVASGWGLCLGSSKDLHCTFRGNGHIEHYTGSISKFGVDIGYTEGRSPGVGRVRSHLRHARRRAGG